MMLMMHSLLIKFAVLFHTLLHTTRGAECEMKFQVIDRHTACLHQSALYVPGAKSSTSEADKELIVDEHNRYRSLVQPPSANMMKMVWDEELEMLASRWAQNCVYEHEGLHLRTIPGKYSVGQNLALNMQSWNETVYEWYIEHEHYQYGVGNIHNDTENNPIGHYTQMSYAESARIGCARAECSGVGLLYVCDYSHINSRPLEPYQNASKACTGCPAHCSDQLCDFNGTVCHNGGALNTTTGVCACENNSLMEGNCELNCSQAVDHWDCPRWKNGCRRYVNVPYDCPHMCDICPYAGIDYVKPMSTSSRMTSSPLLLATVWLTSPIIINLQH